MNLSLAVFTLSLSTALGVCPFKSGSNEQATDGTTIGPCPHSDIDRKGARRLSSLVNDRATITMLLLLHGKRQQRMATAVSFLLSSIRVVPQSQRQGRRYRLWHLRSRRRRLMPKRLHQRKHLFHLPLPQLAPLRPHNQMQALRAKIRRQALSIRMAIQGTVRG